MLSKKMEAALNEQINAELYSAYLYLSMSSWFQTKNLKGFANWMYIQWQEETAHAMKFFNYVNERGGTVVLKAIDKPKASWKNIVEVYAETLKHEQHVTSLIHNLANIAVTEKDHATNNFLQWFISEQVEEEATAGEILEELKLIEGKGPALLMIDREMRQRVFTPPVDPKA